VGGDGAGCWPRLVLATRNPGKLREMRAILADLPLETVPVAELLPAGPQVRETAVSFAENAILKAQSAVRRLGLPALGEDSGLEVDALGGLPGIHSARFGGPGLDDEGRYQKLLAMLEGLPPAARTARFRAAVAVALPGGAVYVAEGRCEGLIATAPRGRGGFGYDPVFLVPELGRTFAELTPDEKAAVSHRGRALRAARPLIRQVLALGPEPVD